MSINILESKRKSFLEPGEIFFWTATVNQWKQLLLEDGYKEVIVRSLKYLTDKGKIDVFGFVIMPNHIHLIWRIIEMNDNESPSGSFLKYTAHEFKKMLKNSATLKLADFAVNALNKKYEFWKRDSLAVHIISEQVAYQKLDYIHSNPLSGKWQLVTDPCDYEYSSAAYYEMGKREFPFLKDLRMEF